MSYECETVSGGNKSSKTRFVSLSKLAVELSLVRSKNFTYKMPRFVVVLPTFFVMFLFIHLVVHLEEMFSCRGKILIWQF